MPPVMEIASKQSTLQQANKHTFPDDLHPEPDKTGQLVFLKAQIESPEGVPSCVAGWGPHAPPLHAAGCDVDC